MRGVRCSHALLLLALLAGAGCAGKTAPAPADTGSREVVRGFYEAVVRQEWPAGHALLSPESQRQCSRDDFARRGSAYRRGLGFEPQKVHVRLCEEHGEEALAHVVLTGTSGGRTMRYRDGLTLRRSGGSWTVVLPAGFGGRGR